MPEDYFFEPNDQSENGLPFSFHIQDTSVRGSCAQPHIQEYLEILYCHAGAHRVMLNGVVSQFNAGDLMVINPHVIHSVYSLGGPDNCYTVLKFDPNLVCSLSGFAAEQSYLLPFRSSGTPNQTLFSARELEHTDIPVICSEIKREFENKEYGYELALKIQAERLLLWVLRRWKETAPLPVGKQSQKLNGILDYLWKHYDQKLQGTQVAAMFYISYSHLSCLIRSATGMSFVKYLNYIRMTQAKKLLITTDRSVTEIALDTGFSSSSYFIEQFREAEGMSPGKFRRM